MSEIRSHVDSLLTDITFISEIPSSHKFFMLNGRRSYTDNSMPCISLYRYLNGQTYLEACEFIRNTIKKVIEELEHTDPKEPVYTALVEGSHKISNALDRLISTYSDNPDCVSRLRAQKQILNLSILRENKIN